MSGLEGLLAGRVLVNRYRIGEVIGRGGFAAVYRADDERLGRPVAVKVITLTPPDEATRTLLHERFAREARAAASLPPHPNVVQVYDFGTDPELGLDFLVMELLRGRDLATRLAAEGPPPVPEALAVLRDAAAGVAVGHRAGLVHRDVKPGNVFLADPHGDEPVRVCVVDFGIARVTEDEGTLTRLTTHGTGPLSPAYASPEQLRGDLDLTPASDVFSLGVVGWELLAGSRPFGPERAAGDPLPPDPLRRVGAQVPRPVEDVLRRALSRDPDDRYADAAAFGAALEDALAAGDRRRGAPLAGAAAAAVAVPEGRTEPAEDATLVMMPPPSAPRRPAAAPPPSARPAAAAGRGGAGKWVALLGLVALLAFGGWMVMAPGDEGGPEEVAAGADVEVDAAGAEEDGAASVEESAEVVDVEVLPVPGSAASDGGGETPAAGTDPAEPQTAGPGTAIPGTTVPGSAAPGTAMPGTIGTGRVPAPPVQNPVPDTSRAAPPQTTPAPPPARPSPEPQPQPAEPPPAPPQPAEPQPEQREPPRVLGTPVRPKPVPVQPRPAGPPDTIRLTPAGPSGGAPDVAPAGPRR